MTSNKKIIMIGISGASCSGKTTLARWLQRILPNCTIFYQDDFFKPEKDIPIDTKTNLANWDCPEAIDFLRFTKTLKTLHKTGRLPATFKSKEGFNIRKEIDGYDYEPLIQRLSLRVNKFFQDIKHGGDHHDSNNINGHDMRNDSAEYNFMLIDGFLLYCDMQVVRELDIKLFVKADYETLKIRREARAGYVTVDGSFWSDPPNYFDNIVWPNFVRAHSHLFSGRKEIELTIDDLVILNSDNALNLMENIEKAVEKVLEYVGDNLHCDEMIAEIIT